MHAYHDPSGKHTPIGTEFKINWINVWEEWSFVVLKAMEQKEAKCRRLPIPRLHLRSELVILHREKLRSISSAMDCILSTDICLANTNKLLTVNAVSLAKSFIFISWRDRDGKTILLLTLTSQQFARTRWNTRLRWCIQEQWVHNVHRYQIVHQRVHTYVCTGQAACAQLENSLYSTNDHTDCTYICTGIVRMRVCTYMMSKHIAYTSVHSTYRVSKHIVCTSVHMYKLRKKCAWQFEKDEWTHSTNLQFICYILVFVLRLQGGRHMTNKQAFLWGRANINTHCMLLSTYTWDTII